MSNAYEQATVRCPLSKWQGDLSRCRWCNGPLSGRQQKWCSSDCADAFGNNHWWTMARKQAMRRDLWTCQDCGFVGWREQERIEIKMYDQQLSQRSATPIEWAYAYGAIDRADYDRFIELDARLDARWDEHHALERKLVKIAHDFLGEELYQALRRDCMQFNAYRRVTDHGTTRHTLEVDHVVQIWGKHSQTGCHHHLDGLRTRCRPCHRKKTAEERKTQAARNADKQLELSR